MSPGVRDDVLALVPAYNEGRHVGEVVAGVREHLPVVVVDDGSTDDTAEAARGAGAEVLVQNPNQGKGAALRRGLLHGVSSGYRAVVTLDADGQHRPDEIPRFLDAYDTTSAQLVIGYRSFDAMPPVRRFGNTVGTWLFSQAVGRPIADNQSGYRLLRAELIDALDWSSVGFEMEVEMIVQAVALGHELGWVPISTIYGDEQSHFRPIHDSVGFLRTVLRARRRVRAAR